MQKQLNELDKQSSYNLTEWPSDSCAHSPFAMQVVYGILSSKCTTNFNYYWARISHERKHFFIETSL